MGNDVIVCPVCNGKKNMRNMRCDHCNGVGTRINPNPISKPERSKQMKLPTIRALVDALNTLMISSNPVHEIFNASFDRWGVDLRMDTECNIREKKPTPLMQHQYNKVAAKCTWCGWKGKISRNIITGSFSKQCPSCTATGGISLC